MISTLLLILATTAVVSTSASTSSYACQSRECYATGCFSDGSWGPGPGTGVRIKRSGMIAAVHPGTLPCGTWIEINGERRWVIDRAGPDVPRGGVDLLMPSRKQFGRKQMKYKIVGRQIPDDSPRKK